MFHVLLVFTIAISVGLGSGSHRTVGQATVEATQTETGTGSLLDNTNITLPEDTGNIASLLDGTDGSPDVATGDWQPEPQIPTGKFTTATEVKPILSATKTAWLALREYDGNDLLYFTHLAAWRCGLHEIRFSLNGAPEQVFEVEECYIDTAQPNALKMETHLPYIVYDLGSVDNVTVTLTFDDGTEDSATYQRPDILVP